MTAKSTPTIHTADSLADLKLPQLWDLLEQLTGTRSKAPNRKFLTTKLLSLQPLTRCSSVRRGEGTTDRGGGRPSRRARMVRAVGDHDERPAEVGSVAVLRRLDPTPER